MTPGKVALDTASIGSLDLLDPNLHATRDLTEVWRRLRRDEPLRWQSTPADCAVPGFWCLTRHADVLRVARDDRRFTSLRGNMLGTLLRGDEPGSGQMLVVSDGRFHAALRSLLAAGFGPRSLGPIEHCVAVATGELLDAMLERGGGDFAGEVAAQIPLRAICELLAVPESDRAQILEFTNAAMLGAHTRSAGLEARIAQSEILLYYTGLAAHRRTAPGSDIISMLVGSEVEGRPLTDEEVVANCYNLIIGGDETARFALSGGLIALAENEPQWLALRADPTLVGTGTEEILRWTTPAMHVGRTATVPVEIHGRTVAAGEVLALWNVSANRDERVFPAPDEFDLAREPNRHVTFGYGPHFCIGAQLARTEIKALLAGLRRKVKRVEVAGSVEWLPSTFVSGACALPVALTPG